MCGINGTVGLSKATVIEKMNKAMQHRGPDGQGVFVDSFNNCALGHTRLSIIDLSNAGHQPMSYRKGRYQIVFNGEIYNYLRLKKELVSLGHKFTSQSDTEVLVAAYAQWGRVCVNRLEGMFSFAILDFSEIDSDGVQLFIARDRFGIKPLYYALRNNVLIFSSEIKGLLASKLTSRKVDRQAIWHFLSLGSFPQPSTVLSDVKMLMPAHTLTYNNQSGPVISKYWDIAESSKRNYPGIHDYDSFEASQLLRKLLDDATQRHLVADVPVGAFLSGGIDSTAVVGLMSELTGKKIRTYSLGFEGLHANIDELKWARIAAERFDTDHTEIIVSGKDVAEDYEAIIHSLDQPSLDGTNTYLVSKVASEDVKVVLSGLGGDEIFAGYRHFNEFFAADKFDKYIRWLGNNAASMLVKAIPGRFLANKNMLLMKRSERYQTLRNICDDKCRYGVISADFIRGFEPETIGKIYEPWLNEKLQVIEETSYVELNGYLVNTLLRDADAMSMANSLEVRPVLLDHAVAEFAFALPPSLKINDTELKPALVNAVRDLLPESLIKREKMGFELPLISWLRGPLKDRALSTFSSNTAKSIFSSSFLGDTISNLHQGSKLSYREWAYMNLINWLQMNDCEI